MLKPAAGDLHLGVQSHPESMICHVVLTKKRATAIGLFTLFVMFQIFLVNDIGIYVYTVYGYTGMPIMDITQYILGFHFHQR